MKTKSGIGILCFGLLMIGLGISDALRGIFAPVFQNRYELSESQLSMMISVSYVGNLLFLSIGGKLLDTFSRKKVMTGVVGVWLGALLINLSTDHFAGIVISMFLALGASTLLNTTVNILTPSICMGYAGLMVNVFFFLQGVGTSGSQFFLGRYAFSYEGFQGISGVLLVIGLVVGILLLSMTISTGNQVYRGEEEKQKKEPERIVFYLFIVMMGCYFIGEHGIMNWMMSYCISAFSMESGTASFSLSLFWGGMTLGRLIFAPVVQMLGAEKSLTLFGGIGTLMFGLGCIWGSSGIMILGGSGLALSIVYPTMVLLIQQIYPQETAATKTGVIISIATIADIVFNVLFGVAANMWGYRVSFFILPVAMIGFYGCYLSLKKQAILIR